MFLVPYPIESAPSQRYRFEQYLEHLSENGFSWDFYAFFDQSTWDVLYKEEHFSIKIAGTIFGLAKRFLLLFRIRKYNWVFIHREAIPFGPPWYEWVLHRIFNKRLIYDFDDAIWLKQTSEANTWAGLVKPRDKTAKICGMSEKICVGNFYLASYARNYNQHVTVIPTTINTTSKHSQVKKHNANDKIVIGWTGTHSTIPYLDLVVDAIAALERSYSIRFMIICDKPPDFKLKSMEFKEWSKEEEVEDLMQFDIGLMPLPKSEWALGKCGLKALQYMALGIPAVVTGFGANVHIVTHGVEGFQCHSESDWVKYIEMLIINSKLRKQMGVQGREKVVNKYSVESNFQSFVSLFGSGSSNG